MNPELLIRRTASLVAVPVRAFAQQSAAGRRWINVLRLRAHLDALGWFRSLDERMPVDRDGNSLPWITYPAIAFLAERVRKDMRVFEFGSGNSTRWWAGRVEQVTSCEHDAGWYAQMKDKLPPNVSYNHVPLGPDDAYPSLVARCGIRFHVIVIDGRERVKCAKYAVSALTDDGVIVWDNSDREKYTEGYRLLIDAGFRRIDFFGIAPMSKRFFTTSVFYRSNNCLGI
jgi:hypothetical protein